LFPSTREVGGPVGFIFRGAAIQHRARKGPMARNGPPAAPRIVPAPGPGAQRPVDGDFTNKRGRKGGKRGGSGLLLMMNASWSPGAPEPDGTGPPPPEQVVRAPARGRCAGSFPGPRCRRSKDPRGAPGTGPEMLGQAPTRMRPRHSRSPRSPARSPGRTPGRDARARGPADPGRAGSHRSWPGRRRSTRLRRPSVGQVALIRTTEHPGSKSWAIVGASILGQAQPGTLKSAPASLASASFMLKRPDHGRVRRDGTPHPLRRRKRRHARLRRTRRSTRASGRKEGRHGPLRPQPGRLAGGLAPVGVLRPCAAHPAPGPTTRHWPRLGRAPAHRGRAPPQSR